MTVTINGTTGYTGPIGAIGDLSTTGNTTLGDASGDTLTINGSTTTFTQGTANGVAYLNGSKVLTTGSALTFDGTTFATTAVASFAAGSASAPAITRTGDTNTGIFFPAADTIAFAEGGTEAMRLDSAGNMGLGVTPKAWGTSSGLDIGAWTGVGFNSSNGNTVLTNNAYIDSSGTARYKLSSFAATALNLTPGGAFAWQTAGSGTAGNAISFTQAMTLTSAGRLGIGQTNPSEALHVSGAIRADNGSGSVTSLITTGGGSNFQVVHTSGDATLTLLNSANAYGGFRLNGSTGSGMVLDSGGDFTFRFGWLKSFSAGPSAPNTLGIGTGDTGLMFIPIASAPARIIPRNFAGTGADNAIDLGDAGSRFRTIFAATGTINTSDAREKTPVTPLTADELTAAAQIAASVGTYQWLHAVEEKGAGARHHAGLTVQRAIEIMEANNLNPFDYGFICYDSWQGEEAGDRYSFRMDELSLFIARGQQAIIEQLKSRLDAANL